MENGRLSMCAGMLADLDAGSARVASLRNRADAFRADLVVVGAYGRSQLTEWVFGGVTRTFLHEAQLPVLMSR